MYVHNKQHLTLVELIIVRIFLKQDRQLKSRSFPFLFFVFVLVTFSWSTLPQTGPCSKVKKRGTDTIPNFTFGFCCGCLQQHSSTKRLSDFECITGVLLKWWVNQWNAPWSQCFSLLLINSELNTLFQWGFTVLGFTLCSTSYGKLLALPLNVCWQVFTFAFLFQECCFIKHI